MKFGKKILQMSQSSQALCPEEDWMNYKQLKKLLHEVEGANNSKTSGKTTGHPQNTNQTSKSRAKMIPVIDEASRVKRTESIVACEYEKAFFTFLKQELRKVTNNFCKLEAKLFRQFNNFLPKLRALKTTNDIAASTGKTNQPQPCNQKAVSAVIEECAELHLLFISLESYAVINYAGFTKILKKHDKVTGTSTREKYMLKLVDDKSFAQHKRIKVALNAVTIEFENLKKMLMNSNNNNTRRGKKQQVDCEEEQGETIKTDVYPADAAFTRTAASKVLRSLSEARPQQDMSRLNKKRPILLTTSLETSPNKQFKTA